MNKRSKIIEVQTEHPLEEVFEIEPGTSVVERIEPITGEIITTEEYDEKDREVDCHLSEVYEAAMNGFEATTLTIENIEPKYRARNEEVSVQFLTIALGAAREKALVKAHKDKVALAKNKSKAPTTVNNNLIIDRNELLKHMLGQQIKDDTKK